MIAEHEIDTVFDDRAIAQLLVRLERSPSAKLFTETDRQRFTDSIHMAVRCYLAEHARTNWPVIAKQVRTLYRLLDKADGGNARAVAELAKQVDATDPATRAWLERCLHHKLTFPSGGEIANKEKRHAAMRGCAGCFATAGPGLKAGRGQADSVPARGNHGCACRRTLAPAARLTWRRVNWCNSWR